MAFTRGLTEVADGTWAYLQPDGSWGYSNAGLVSGDGTSLLVDTLFDLALTRDMLTAMARVLERGPIETVVNTHANGDHTYGNQLVSDARIVASEAAAREMDEVPPALLHSLAQIDLGPDGNRFVAEAFGPFRFDDIVPTPPTETFAGRLELDIGGRQVALEVVGPAHTAGDVIAHVPDAGVVFTGDIVFHGSTPIVWAGPLDGWRAACRRIAELAPSVVVPGHGPVTDLSAVALVDGYLAWVLDEVALRREVGMSALEAAWDIEPGAYGDWHDGERLVVNVDAAYAQLDPGHQRMDVLTSMTEMGRYRFGR
ncbi:MAG: beta-lactamase domain protein [Acidimicrobiales bacterium]|nr:beta-lactamase domain protein [Acidimicrobiales bacterium]